MDSMDVTPGQLGRTGDAQARLATRREARRVLLHPSEQQWAALSDDDIRLLAWLRAHGGGRFAVGQLTVDALGADEPASGMSRYCATRLAQAGFVKVAEPDDWTIAIDIIEETR